MESRLFDNKSVQLQVCRVPPERTEVTAKQQTLAIRYCPSDILSAPTDRAQCTNKYHDNCCHSLDWEDQCFS